MARVILEAILQLPGIHTNAQRSPVLCWLALDCCRWISYIQLLMAIPLNKLDN